MSSAVQPVAPGPDASGAARVDGRTKNLLRRLRSGEVAVIDHEDLDRIAAEGLVAAGVVAVVNAAPSASGRYPNIGPLVLTAAGIPLVDACGPTTFDVIRDGAQVAVVGDQVWVDGAICLHGTRQTTASLEAVIEEARHAMGEELERFAENTLSYLQREAHLLVDDPHIPDIALDFRGRQVLVVVRGADYREDLELLRRTGYIQEMKPLVIGIDGGADALIEAGVTPDLIMGDMDSVSPAALRCGAEIVVHGYPGGDAPGSAVLDELDLPYEVFSSAGTSEDIAMLLAFEKGADLIVLVGSHNSMVDFFDKGRGGMASTFLVRMKVGQILVDARGVSRLYQHRVRKRDLLLLVAAAVFTLAVLLAVSEPTRLMLRGFLLNFR